MTNYGSRSDIPAAKEIDNTYLNGCAQGLRKLGFVDSALASWFPKFIYAYGSELAQRMRLSNININHNIISKDI